MNLEHFIDNYTKAIKEDNAAIFAGAGLSSSAGFVNWKQLLSSVADELGLNVEKEQHDLIGLAQYYCNKHMGRGGLNQIIMDEFQRRAAITGNHRILAKLPISTYWTTNYDTLIETALRETGKNPDVKAAPENLALTLNDRDAVIYKMHGDVNQVHNAVINRDDYERYENTHSLFTTALQGDLVSKTFLFIGFSFNDPNLNYILSRIRLRLEGNQRPHYCFLKKVSKTDEDYAYSKAKQELQVNDLKRFSINTILIDEYSDITDILSKIEQRLKMSTIFVSGSAEEYGAFTEDQAGELLHELSNRIVKIDYKLISGFGVGVGSFVINGALQHLQSEHKRRYEDSIVLRPFPQKASGGKTIETLWEEYRKNMIEDAGIAVFAFGNKRNSKDGNIINANGVKIEFDIAHALGLKIIPIGITGYETKLIYNELMDNFQIYYPGVDEIRPLFKVLGESQDIEVIVSTVIKIIQFIRRMD
ncbi:MAG: SIR2 family protein [Mobilitalea sp.]